MECGVIKNCDFRRTVILLFVLAGLTFMVTYNYVCFKVQPAIIFYTADKREALDHITTVNKQAATSGLKLDIEEDSPERVCDDPFCRDHLTVYEKRLYTECEGKVQKLAHGMMSKDNGCRFLVTKSRKPVALISFPGSGNTWVRQLLEQASGICTGSAMCDMSLRYSGFTGENINTGSTLVVKTHRPKPSWLFGAANYASRIEPKSSDAVYESAIIIVRNPMNAMVSEWNRIVANDFLRKTIRLHAHTKKVGKENFRENEKWVDFIEEGIQKWHNTLYDWAIQGMIEGRKVLVVYYEDLKINTKQEVKRMLDFLGVKYIHRETNNLDEFHRQHNDSATDTFDPFTPEQKTLVHSMIQNTIKEIEENHLDITLTQYLTDYTA